MFNMPLKDRGRGVMICDSIEAVHALFFAIRYDMLI